MRKFFNSFNYAFKGIITAFKSEFNLRFHCIATVLVIIAGIYFHISRTEFCLILVSCGLVISAEIFNTSIETLTNLVSPSQNDLARKTKDMAAAAVLISVIASVLVGLVIFLPKVF